MSRIVVIQFGLSLLAALLGAAFGWWLRGRPDAREAKESLADRKESASQALQSLHAAAESVRSCIEQHTECIRTIQAELDDTSSTEPVIITSAAESIIASNGLVQHQLKSIREKLNDQRQELHDCLAGSAGLLFTYASLDRQKYLYRQVLTSLEILAAELAGEIKGHGQSLQKISGQLSTSTEHSADVIAQAVTQILDATNEVQRRIAVKEELIAEQAETVQMQAILTHADLLTSLPNRRALEDELQRMGSIDGRPALVTLLFIDLDKFADINVQYGHRGGDVILRQAAGLIKGMGRGRDMAARFAGNKFALLLNQTTLHDALPLAEKVRKLIEDTQFSQGTRPLRLTASVGIAQLQPEELRAAIVTRVDEALQAAKQAGGNICFRHDGQSCVPVSAAFHVRPGQAAEESLSLAALWRDSTTLEADEGSSAAGRNAEQAAITQEDPELSGRSLFSATLSRRLAQWKRGGPSISVAVLRVDQLDELVERFGDQGQAFIRQVMGRLVEASTRDMDERCEFEDGLFALLLPGADEANALAVADRLRFQVRQCKVRMGHDLWNLTASIGVAHCTVAARVMDIMLSAEAALNAASSLGGDAVCIGQPVQESQTPVTP
jgi:diguanylate cyclase (GGDEF)-like protein